MSESLIQRSREGIRSSAGFIVLATRNYVNGIRNPNADDPHLLLDQISYAKALGKHTILLFEESLSEEEIQIIKDAVNGMKILGELSFIASDQRTLEQAVKKIAEIVKSEKV